MPVSRIRIALTCLLLALLVSPMITPALAQDAELGSQDNPAPIGTALQSSEFVSLKVKAFTPDATDIVMDLEGAPQPDPGYVISMITLELTYTGPEIENPTDVDRIDALISIVPWGPDAGSYDLFSRVWCHHISEGSIDQRGIPIPGETYQFDTCFNARESDLPNMLLRVDTGIIATGNNSIWFQLGDGVPTGDSQSTPRAPEAPTGRACPTAADSSANAGTLEQPHGVGDCVNVDGLHITLLSVETDVEALHPGTAFFIDSDSTAYVSTYQITNTLSQPFPEEALKLWAEPVGWEIDWSNNDYCSLPDDNPDNHLNNIAPGDTVIYNQCWVVPNGDGNGLVLTAETRMTKAHWLAVGSD